MICGLFCPRHVYEPERYKIPRQVPPKFTRSKDKGSVNQWPVSENCTAESNSVTPAVQRVGLTDSIDSSAHESNSEFRHRVCGSCLVFTLWSGPRLAVWEREGKEGTGPWEPTAKRGHVCIIKKRRYRSSRGHIGAVPPRCFILFGSSLFSVALYSKNNSMLLNIGFACKPLPGVIAPEVSSTQMARSTTRDSLSEAEDESRMNLTSYCLGHVAQTRLQTLQPYCMMYHV